MSESIEKNDAVDPIRTDLDYWTNLKETCERNQKAIREREKLNEENYFFFKYTRRFRQF